jgi:hypothetical protein
MKSQGIVQTMGFFGGRVNFMDNEFDPKFPIRIDHQNLTVQVQEII